MTKQEKKSRERKSLSLEVREKPGEERVYLVSSQSSRYYYRVRMNKRDCTCRDYVINSRGPDKLEIINWACKHINAASNYEAVRLEKKKQENQKPSSKTLSNVYKDLSNVFLKRDIKLKPSNIQESSGRALALAYVDSRVYEERLDKVIGPDNWKVVYKPLGKNSLVCSLTILGVTKEDVGEYEERDRNPWTSAKAQAFKRACSSFGLGRYLYNLPKIWEDFNSKNNKFVREAEIIDRMYQRL